MEIQGLDGAGDAPDMPVNTATEPNYPTFLFNAMINPLVDYAIRGAIWYQGEANVARAAQYRDLLPLMIHDWRRTGVCLSLLYRAASQLHEGTGRPRGVGVGRVARGAETCAPP